MVLNNTILFLNVGLWLIEPINQFFSYKFFLIIIQLIKFYFFVIKITFYLFLF